MAMPDGAKAAKPTFHVSIISASFSGKTRLERQRMIYQVLTEEMTGSVHALAIAARAPEEN